MNLEKIKTDKAFETFYIGIEDALVKAPMITFNDEVVKFNNEVVFFNKKISGTKKLMYLTLDLGIENVEVSEDSFNSMIKSIENKINNKNFILIDYGRKPSAQVLINLDVIKNNLVTLKTNEEVIIVNNIIFTVSNMEFLGDSLFAGKHNSFKVNAETFTYIKKYLIGDANITTIKNNGKINEQSK